LKNHFYPACLAFRSSPSPDRGFSRLYLSNERAPDFEREQQEWNRGNSKNGALPPGLGRADVIKAMLAVKQDLKLTPL